MVSKHLDTMVTAMVITDKRGSTDMDTIQKQVGSL